MRVRASALHCTVNSYLCSVKLSVEPAMACRRLLRSEGMLVVR